MTEIETYKPRKWLNFFAVASTVWVFLMLFAGFGLTFKVRNASSQEFPPSAIEAMVNIGNYIGFYHLWILVIGLTAFLIARSMFDRKYHIPVLLPLCICLACVVLVLIYMTVLEPITEKLRFNYIFPFPFFKNGFVGGLLLSSTWIVGFLNYFILNKPETHKAENRNDDELVLSKNPLVSYFQVWKINREFKKAEIRFKHDYALAQKNGTELPAPPYYKLEDKFKNYKRVFWVARIAVVLIGGFGLIAYITEQGRRELISEVQSEMCRNMSPIARALAC